MFKESDIALRMPIGSDASIMLEWENDKSNWRISNRTEPLVMGEMIAFLEKQSTADALDDLDQIRYIITETKTGKPLGTVDLYEIDWEKETAYVGILIAEEAKRQKGAGLAALKKVVEQAFSAFDLTLVKARIFPENRASQKLFLKAGFIQVENKLESVHSEYLEFALRF